ncbi:MAG TPA: APC family permease [Bacillota bacterium]|nr:APC family permease [Bacillota bacterium]
MEYSAIKRWLIGRPLKSEEAGEHKLNKLKALAILSSDALSSVAYGTEQILIVLMTVSAAALWYSIPISIGVLVLLTALILSYRQVIFSYPKGGGAYMVAKSNLGINFGLIAGSSLLIDYILTVAVSVSAGTDAITSAFPYLHQHTVLISVIMVILVTVLNLRGLTESAGFLAYPVYLFVFALFMLIVTGIYHIVTGTIPHTTITGIGMHVSGISLFLLLKAFSSGCSALTGVEAISNAVPNFKKPEDKNAANTLAMMGALLGILFTGVSFLAYWYGIAPKEAETVVSQIAAETFGRNWAYYFVQGTTALILVLAANTGFSAFPMLAYNLAQDRFMPNMFMVRGDRLGYSNGIITLSLLSIVVIFIFEGTTELLIPLYAVGVFLPFTLAQVGMMIKWAKEKPTGWVPKFIVNTIGALITFTVLAIFFITKFSQVWYSLLFLPICVYICLQIRLHYKALGEQLKIDVTKEFNHEVTGNVVIVPISGISRSVEKTLVYAKSITKNVIAVYIAFKDEDIAMMEEKWEKWNTGVRLITIKSRYRSIINPILKLIDTVNQKTMNDGGMVTVLIPDFITKKLWHRALHNQTALLLRAHLLQNKNVIVSTVPFRLKK